MFTVHKEAKRTESPIWTTTVVTMELISEVFEDSVVSCNYKIIDLNTCFWWIEETTENVSIQSSFQTGSEL